MIGDYNAKDPLWFETRPLDNGHSLAQGKVLCSWARKFFTVERGPCLPTLYRQGEKPSKHDLIWTRQDSEPFTIAEYSTLNNSDHLCLHTRIRLIKPLRNMAYPRPDYKSALKAEMLKIFKDCPPPLTPDEQTDTVNESLKLIPRM